MIPAGDPIQGRRHPLLYTPWQGRGGTMMPSRTAGSIPVRSTNHTRGAIHRTTNAKKGHIMTDPNINPQPHQPQQPYQVQQPVYGQSAAPVNGDTGSFGWVVLGFLLPLVGLILWLVWKDSKPVSAEQAGRGVLASVTITITLTIVVTVAITMISGSPSTMTTVLY